MAVCWDTARVFLLKLADVSEVLTEKVNGPASQKTGPFIRAAVRN
jgi:hypothetical protein